jgi:molecular chaperone GrpE
MESPENSLENNKETVVEQAGALQACQAELQQWKDKFVQMNADMANFRRRVEKDQAQWAHMAQVRVLTKLLSTVDNFERAMAEKPLALDEKVQAWVKGIAMIYTDLTKMLLAFDVTEVPCNGAFDPSLHEALMHVASDGHKSGDIVTVLERGYQMGDTVLRPAKVSVAQ